MRYARVDATEDIIRAIEERSINNEETKSKEAKLNQVEFDEYL
jgi:hypothetical protein